MLQQRSSPPRPIKRGMQREPMGHQSSSSSSTIFVMEGLFAAQETVALPSQRQRSSLVHSVSIMYILHSDASGGDASTGTQLSPSHAQPVVVVVQRVSVFASPQYDVHISVSHLQEALSPQLLSVASIEHAEVTQRLPAASQVQVGDAAVQVVTVLRDSHCQTHDASSVSQEHRVSLLQRASSAYSVQDASTVLSVQTSSTRMQVATVLHSAVAVSLQAVEVEEGADVGEVLGVVGAGMQEVSQTQPENVLQMDSTRMGVHKSVVAVHLLSAHVQVPSVVQSVCPSEVHDVLQVVVAAT